MLAIAKALAFGTVGGAVFAYFHIPLAWMLGALFATAIGGRFLGPARLPRVFRDTVVPVLGVLLGSAFKPEILDHVVHWPAALAIIAAYIVGITGLGFLYFRYGAKLDRVTSFFAALPGGLSDLTIVGADLGADLGRLALIHSIRIVSVVTIVPFALAWLGYVGTRPAPAAAWGIDGVHFIALIACAGTGYVLGRVLRLPAPAILGPLVVSAGIHIAGLMVIVPPFWLVVMAQVVLGSFIGARLAAMQGNAIRSAIGHGIFWGSLVTLIGVGWAALAARGSEMPFPSILLGLAPGGLPEMSVLTLALNADVAFVATAHLARLILVYTITTLSVLFSGWRQRS